MRRNFNKVIKFNETDQTITVQAGMSGPKLEETLQNAQSLFGAKRPYTCGHFPQSFEYSSVGGWTVTRGAGQNSTYYGTIADIVVSQKYATPIGKYETRSLSERGNGTESQSGHDGRRGHLRRSYRGHAQVFRWMPENQKTLFLYVQGLADSYARSS